MRYEETDALLAQTPDQVHGDSFGLFRGPILGSLLSTHWLRVGNQQPFLEKNQDCPKHHWSPFLRMLDSSRQAWVKKESCHQEMGT